MTGPRRIGEKLLEAEADVLPFLRLYLVPQFRLLQRKLAAMLGGAQEFAVPLWDTESWHSVRIGGDAVALPDSDYSVDVTLGGHFVAREGTLTAGHTIGFVGAALYSSVFIWNLTSGFTLNITLSAGNMTLAPNSVGLFMYDPTAIDWVGKGMLPVSAVPEAF